MLQVVNVNPVDKSGFLLPFLVQRVLDFAGAHYGEVSPDTFARAVFARLVAGDPGVLVLAAVGAKGDIVGHATGTIEQWGKDRWVFVNQCRVDPGEGSSDPTVVRRFIEAADVWAREQGVTKMLMASPRSDEAWRRRYGFKTLRHVMSREVGSSLTPMESDPK